MLAHIERRDTALRELYAEVCERSVNAQQRLEGLLHAIGDHLCSHGFRGCPFINAAAEYPERDGAIHHAILEHRAWFAETLLELLLECRHPQAAQTTRRIVLLRDGAMVSGYLDDARAAREDFTDAVRDLLEV